MSIGVHYPDAYRIMGEAVEEAIRAMQTERAAAIAFLPEACSQRVETAIELLRAAQGNILLAQPVLAGLNEKGVRAVIANVLTLSDPALALLSIASQECVKVSPTYVEYWPNGLNLISLGSAHYRKE